jgi:5-carboxymethyl-2-hydroxymuconate isomerase
MPHQIIEYSANIESRTSIRDLVDRLHETAMGIDGLPVGGLRTRAERREIYQVADRHPDNAFVHLTLRLGHGRPLEKRREFGEAIFKALCDLLEPVSSTSPLAISFEIQEIHPELTWKKNNLRDYIARRESEN